MLTHKGTVTLNTQRLILRRLTIDDAQAMYDNWATDEKVNKYLSWNLHASVEATKELLTKWIAEYENPEQYCWVIEYDNTIIGTIGLHAISNKSLHCDMGYCIGSKWWGKGIVTEAARAVIKFAFNEIGMNKVCALHDTENIGSGRVMEKNGMIREGCFRKHSLRRDGTWGDTNFYSILKDNWIEKKG